MKRHNSKTLYNQPYFWKINTQSYFFCFLLYASITFFPPISQQRPGYPVGISNPKLSEMKNENMKFFEAI